MGTAGPYLSLQTDVLCTGTLICRNLLDNGPLGLILPQPVVTQTLGIGMLFVVGGKHKHRTFVLVMFVGLDNFINAVNIMKQTFKTNKIKFSFYFIFLENIQY